jgi:hypothetical protein
MKVAASRTIDLDDISLLARHLDLKTADRIITLAERGFGEPISDRKRMIIEDPFPSPGS